ncbi:MAG: hypothetical protein M5U12_23040 [Verrucomicrobia bacterium]|nr:hypothetical protein [Verrucomicrobiota bacterium]
MRLDFPADRIQVSLYLSEKRAQELAVLLRESKPAAGAANLRKLLHGRLAGVFKPGSRRLKMIHESVLPGKWNDALRRLPAALSARLVQQMQQWMDRNLVDFIREQSAKVIAATEDAADGITFRIAIVNPPGFASLREALQGSLTALVGLVFSGSAPTVQITVHPGRTDD